MAATVRIVPQGEIARGTSDPPQVRLPATSLFADRAMRFGTLARNHPDADYLGFLARLCEGQHAALSSHPQPAPPSQQHLERCTTHGLPPLGVDRPLDPSWRSALEAILRHVETEATPATGKALARLRSASDEQLAENARDLLDLNYPALDAATAPLIAAALQVHWVKQAAALGAAHLASLDVANLCPACGSFPVASVLAIDVPAPGTRYLHCALCACEWRLSRGQCSHCDTAEKVAYFHVEGGNDAAKAEACEECKGYLKVFNREKDPQADPVADDLATLSLDVLMDQSGYQRSSPNFFFVPGPA